MAATRQSRIVAGDTFDKKLDAITGSIMAGMLAVILICAVLPVIVGQIMGLSANEVLIGWGGLAGFQTLAYLIPTALIFGAIVIVIRYFTGNRE